MFSKYFCDVGIFVFFVIIVIYNSFEVNLPRLKLGYFKVSRVVNSKLVFTD